MQSIVTNRKWLLCALLCDILAGKAKETGTGIVTEWEQWVRWVVSLVLPLLQLCSWSKGKTVLPKYYVAQILWATQADHLVLPIVFAVVTVVGVLKAVNCKTIPPIDHSLTEEKLSCIQSWSDLCQFLLMSSEAIRCLCEVHELHVINFLFPVNSLYTSFMSPLTSLSSIDVCLSFVVLTGFLQHRY